MKIDNNQLHAVLFDVDGTLADTERDGHRLAFNAAFEESGLDWNWGIEALWGVVNDYGWEGTHSSLHREICPRKVKQEWAQWMDCCFTPDQDEAFYRIA